MSFAHDDIEDLDERLLALESTASDLGQRCHDRSSRRLAWETRRLAKAEQRVIPYLNSTFRGMVHALDMLEPELTREAAVELIALLESPDQARLIQPDLPEAEYDYTVGWMSACAYDNLAQSTAHLQGYNSAGMHQCITEGIQVCRRTGKLECITCFREYATEVYEAADDLAMARHFARLGAEQQVVGPQDRRWAGMQDLARLHRLQGQVDESLEFEGRALSLCHTFHTPLRAFLLSRNSCRETLLVAGREAEWEKYLALVQAADGTASPLPFGAEPEAGEHPKLELQQALGDATAACVAGNYEHAFTLLQPWDRLLTQNRDFSAWLEVRLRLVATQRLAGNAKRAQALASPLEERAKQAQDWLTLRRLSRLLDESLTPSPLALVGDLREGPFAAHGPHVVVPAEVPGAEIPADVPELLATEQPLDETPPTPLAALIGDFMQRLGAAESEEATKQTYAAVLNDVLAIPPTAVTHVGDADWLLYYPRFILEDGERGRELWAWAQAVATNFPTNADVRSLLGALGSALRDAPAAGFDEAITHEQLEKLFQQALSLDPNSPLSFGRAGEFYLGLENLGEAERCFARGFRLARDNSVLALRLAEVYQQTDRPRDALVALDMCLREGCQDPDVAWQAALIAGSLEQFDSQLLYLDQFESVLPGQPWASYYRAMALLSLQRPDEAREAAAEEARCNPNCPFLTLILTACCAGAQGLTDEFRERLQQVLAVRPAEVDYLAPAGFRRQFARLWQSAAELPEDDALRGELENRLLVTGLTPDELFAQQRQRGQNVRDVNFYRVAIQQALDAAWPQSFACLPGEEDWASYASYWGVLARSEEEARELALAVQSRCYPGAAEVLEVDPGETGYEDVPGVVWQGFRQGEAPTDGGV